MAKQISFRYKGNDYILEYNRKTCANCGIEFSELEQLEDKPELALDLVPRIWEGAFLMHHPSISKETIKEIYTNIKGKDEGLPVALVEMYAEPLTTLFSKEGNVEWKKSWE